MNAARTTTPEQSSKATDRKEAWRGPGGAPGGAGKFIAGLLLALGGLWFLFDSVQVTSGNWGFLSGMVHGWMGDRWSTASMGVIFVPFCIGVAMIFYDARSPVAWGVLIFGLGVLLVEILSQFRFVFNMKTSMLLLILGMIAGGTGLMIRAVREDAAPEDTGRSQPPAS